jgi:hypothetical protein
LPVIDFKWNLQNRGLVWERNGLQGTLQAAGHTPLVGRFAQRDEHSLVFSSMISMTGAV